MTTSPPQPPQNPYPGQPGGYGPPSQQFPRYAQPQTPPQNQPQQPGPQQNGQPQYGGQPPQHPYGQQPFQPPYQQGGFQQAFAPQMQMQCLFCGGYPATDATVRGHQGVIVFMRFLKLQGAFCRTCGVATVREMTAKSLWQGWWGIGSSIVNPITMLMNIGPMQKFKRLPEPTPGSGPSRPRDPGKPLFQRPAILGLLVPVAVIALIVFVNLNSTSNADVGECLVNDGTTTNPDMQTVDCGSSDAEYRIVGKLDDTTDDSQCEQFADAQATYVYQRSSTEYVLCLAPV